MRSIFDNRLNGVVEIYILFMKIQIVDNLTTLQPSGHVPPSQRHERRNDTLFKGRTTIKLDNKIVFISFL